MCILWLFWCIQHRSISLASRDISIIGVFRQIKNVIKQMVCEFLFFIIFSRQRHNSLWRSRSTGNLWESAGQRVQDREDITLETMVMNIPIDLASPGSRPRSWSPEDNTAQLLLKTRELGEIWSITELSILTNIRN